MVSKPGEEKNKSPNPSLAMLFFFIVTSGYCVISIFLNNSLQRLITKVCYILFVIIGQFFINLTLTESMCGLRQWKNTLFITILPWLMIFIVLHLFLSIFPGWLGPFSNTFGYAVAKMMGLPDLMKEILPPGEGNSINRALESVRSDNSLFVNELHTETDEIVFEKIEGTDRDDKNKPLKGPDGQTVYERKKYNETWDKLVEGGIIKEFNGVEKETFKNRLYGFVQMKYAVAEYVWNLLTGFFVTSVTYNYIINAGCSKSPQEMEERYNTYQSEQKKDTKAKEDKEASQTKYTQSA